MMTISMRRHGRNKRHVDILQCRCICAFVSKGKCWQPWDGTLYLFNPQIIKLIRVPCKGSNIFPYFPYECLTATIHQLNNFIRVP